MTIEIFDWIMYFAILYVIYKLMPDDYKEELGALVGCFIMVLYTAIYCFIFWFYSWADFFRYLGNIFENTHFKW